jgi:tetratricopeptide (TPR) repeat protein
MNLFKMLFGRTPPMDSLRQACADREWARALAVGRPLQGTPLSAAEQEERDRLLLLAGNSLALVNLEEGEAFRRLGDEERAREHFGLALEQAGDLSLRERIATALQGEESPPALAPRKDASSCSSCASAAPVLDPIFEVEDDLDPQTRFELILASYPLALAQRYQNASSSVREAFLLAHAGRNDEALGCLEQIPEGERDDLFHFESGSLLARLGVVEPASQALERAAASPSLRIHAIEALINLQLMTGQEAKAHKRLQALLAQGEAPAFCHTRLAYLLAQGDAAKALEHGRQALALGVAEPDLLRLVASILEKNGHLAEAEHLLSRLPGTGGCSGGTVSTYLAEFWMRHNMHLDRSLEAFKGAARGEPDNPRWSLRIAQTYVRRGWKKEGLAMLEKVLLAPELNAELYQEGKSLLDAHR